MKRLDNCVLLMPYTRHYRDSLVRVFLFVLVMGYVFWFDPRLAHWYDWEPAGKKVNIYIERRRINENNTTTSRRLPRPCLLHNFSQTSISVVFHINLSSMHLVWCIRVHNESHIPQDTIEQIPWETRFQVPTFPVTKTQLFFLQS